MKPIITKFLNLTQPNITQLHPIVLRTCRTVEDYVACLNTNIHFTKIHAVADKEINPYPLGKLFKRHPNIIIPEEGNTMWDLKEASQATMFQNLADKGVVSGTYDIMQRKYPQEIFISNQEKPDVCQSYKHAKFSYKNTHGLDWKNIMGKTQMHGKNQVLIGTLDRYENVLDAYEETLFTTYQIKNVSSILKTLRTLAKEQNWNNQVLYLAQHLHEFPQKAFPPLYTSKKIDLDTFAPDVQLKIIEAKRKLRWYSKRAYELNIPEDNFSESHVQQVLSET